MIQLRSDRTIRGRSNGIGFLLTTQSRMAILSVAYLATLLVADRCSAAAMQGKRGFMVAPGPEGVDQFANVAAVGGNIVRMQIWLRDGGLTRAQWIDEIERAAREAERLDINLVVDMHHPRFVPGTEVFDNGGHVIDGVVARQPFVNFWSDVATRLADIGKPRKIWFDLINEPGRRTLAGDDQDMRKLMIEAAQAIRAVDADRPIVVPHFGATTDNIVKDWRPLPDIGGPQILGVHAWDWPTVQLPEEVLQEGESQVDYGTPGYTSTELERNLERVANAAAKYSVPVFVGEVGVANYYDYADEFLHDFFSLVDSQHPDFNVAIHAFRGEAPVWDYSVRRDTWHEVTDFLGKPVGEIAGDYNGDGRVGMADYTTWRNTLGGKVPWWSAADGNGDGTIGGADYHVWKSGFGDTATDPLSASSVPEPPATILGLSIAALGGIYVLRKS